MLLHTVRGLFELFERNVMANISDMMSQRDETRAMLFKQHQALFDAIMQGDAELARRASNQHMEYVREVLAEQALEQQRVQRSERRQQLFDN